MGACRYVGRVGGLAVALGVGAAVFGGAAPAWAEGPDAGGPSATETGTSQSAPAAARQSRSATSAKRAPAAAPTVDRAGGSAGSPRAGAAVAPRVSAPVRTALEVEDRAAATSLAPAADPVAAPAPVANTAPAISTIPAPAAATPGRTGRAVPVAAPAAAPAPVEAVLSAAAGTVIDAPAGGNGVLPVDSPLDEAMLAYARRLAAPAASAAVVPAAATQLSLIIGPSGVPVPTEFYQENVTQLYGLPEPGQLLFTPEGLYPITGPKSLPFSTSVDQGIEILARTLDEVNTLMPGVPITVFGYSQSAVIGSLLQEEYNGFSIAEDQEVEFVFVGNEMNPNGGFLSRFPGLQLPSLGLDFYGGTPADAYPTTNYALEYDGFADFPRYPLNFLSVLNAGLGIVFVHVKYADVDYMTPLLPDKIALPVLPGTEDTQKYFFVPTENLPLLEPLRAIPLIGNPIADLVQPVLKAIVDLGYGDPAHGYHSGVQPLANVETPFGLFPQVDPLEVLERIIDGVGQGVNDFVAAFGPDGSIARELSAFALPALPSISFTPDGIISAVQDLVTGVATFVSNAASSIYASLLPTADIINAIVLPLPAYAVELVLDGLEMLLSGDILNGLAYALVAPVAAGVGLITTATLVGALVWAQGIAGAFGIAAGT